MQLPEQLIDRLKLVAGFNEQSFRDAHNALPPVSVRYNALKAATIPRPAENIPWCSEGFYLPERPVFTLDPEFQAGAYYVQEASSMLIEQAVRAISAEKALRVLDLCAAPGGKSTHLMSILPADSLLISNEVIRTRATILEENITRWGQMNTWVTCNDPKEFAVFEGYFDLVVIDAPCSGSGLFRKDPAALQHWSSDNVAMCSARQKRIIADIWDTIKDGGHLIYATCSYSREEDEEILDWITNSYDAETISIPLDTSWGIAAATTSNNQTGYRCYPGRTRGEGFFMSLIHKNGAQKPFQYQKTKGLNQQKFKDQASHLLNADFSCISTSKDTYNAISPTHEPDWLILNKRLYFRKTGIQLGSPGPKEWIPAHDTALSAYLPKDVPSVEVNREQALKFLKREDFVPDSEGKGWKVVKFNNLGLGWVKMLDSRVNNYFPKHLRIRMELPPEI